MNKTAFLTRLQESIAMLEDEEQKDILDEYAQHIDMKVESGMTQQEAIADFGPLDELVDEILSAYHVKPQASAAQDTEQQSATTRAVRATKKAGSELRRSVSALAANADKIIGKAKTAVGTSKAKRQERAAQAESDPEEGTMRTNAVSAWWRRMTEAANLKALPATLLRACKAIVRWAWNLCIAVIAACLIGCSAVLIVTLGFCIALLVDGYPLVGIVISSFGGFVAALSLAGLCVMLIRKKKSGASTPAGA